VIILAGAGSAFCAGFDLTELASGAAGADAAAAGSDIRIDLIPAIEQFPGPIIAAVNGAAATAGFELALACDLIVASSEARFADTHARVGILPGWGLSQRLPRLIGIARAKELAFTGSFLDAERAERWGLVNRVVAGDQLLPTAHALAREMIAAPRSVLADYKRLIDDGYATNLGSALELEAERALESARRMPADGAAARRDEVVRRARKPRD